MTKEKERYDFAILPEAKTFIDRCSKKIQPQIVEKIDFILDDPWRSNTKQLKGDENTYDGLPIRKIRSGKYRILYIADQASKLLTVIEVGRREDIYKGRSL